ncbi:MAG: substrate-binding domain-containing protein [Thiobacillus sp.]|nr:substrate-binding domain-containing protein [Thiobacillus sp.]
MMAWLNWPDEQATPANRELPRFGQYAALHLDLHGDPLHAKLVVFSDGNHHMALHDALQAFALAHPEVGEIFYTTTPPRIATEMLRTGGLEIGNLRLCVTPHVVISPPAVLASLVDAGCMQAHRPFMRSRGVVMLVKNGNPKGITGVADLLRRDVRLFLSNPVTEKASHQIYMDCLRRLAMHARIDLDFLKHASGLPDPEKLVYGELIHHREAPQAIVDERADAAMVFYHLALRYQRIFPEHFDYVWPAGSLDDQACDTSVFSCGLAGNGGEWGQALLDFLFSDAVTKIYEHHGLSRAVP